MPTYNARLLTVDEKETRRYAGLAGCTDFPAEFLATACLTAQLLAKPQGIWQTYLYDAETATLLSQPPFTLIGDRITSHLADSMQVAVIAVTIGDAIEHEISHLFTQGEYTAGLLLDAAATTAVESAADQLNRIIEQQAARLGYTTTWRFSPGYGDWDVAVQHHILDLAQAHRIDITATASCMLVPRKSITAIIGFVPLQNKMNMPPVHAPEVSCSECSINHCTARKESSNT